MSMQGSQVNKSSHFGGSQQHSLRTGSGQLLRASAAQNILNGTKKGPDRNSKNQVVVTIDEIQRIKDSCTLSNQYEQEFKMQERKTLQGLSNNRVKNWPNTIDALRKKKDEERIKRLEEEEIERRKVDAIEYGLQVKERTDAIERANKMMHDNQDQVKAFHSKMLLCDTLQERDLQQQLKKRKDKFDQQIQQQWYDLEQQQMEEHDDKMRQKLMNEYEKKISNAKVIKDQHQDFKMRMIKNYQEEQLEGELIRRQADDELERERQREIARKQKQLQQRDVFNKANQELMANKDLEKQKELEHEKRIEVYKQKRDALEQLRKDKEEQRFKEKQQISQRIIDIQSEKLKNIKDRADEILNKQVNEAEAKAGKLYEEQERKQLELKDQIDRSRKLQIEKRLREKDEEKRANQEMTEYWKIRNEELQIAEQQEKEEERLRNEQLKNNHMKMIAIKQQKLEDDFRKEQEAATKAQALLDQNEKQFYSYAESAIKNWQDQGKNIKPLLIELKTYNKRLVS